MKQDRLSALRQRLKRGSFEFGALLEGVSTLDGPRPPEERRPPIDDRLPATEDRVPIEEEAAPELELVAPEAPAVELAEPVIAEVEIVEEVFSGIAESVDDLEDPFATDPFHDDLDDLLPQRSPQLERIRVALDSLGCRFLHEVGAFRASVAEEDTQEGGFHLAHLNQVLELLRDIDPDGDLARDLETVAAPPLGRGWPAACWTVVEFAASPFSALLPARADESFVRDLLYAAWGVTFEPAE